MASEVSSVRETEMDDINLVRQTMRDSEPNAPATQKMRPRWQLLAAFGSLCIITLMVALDATSLAVALPVIAKALAGSAVEAFWSGTSFLLASTVFQPIIGSLSHIFGRKPLIDASLVLFFIGSVVVASSNNFTSILVGRTVQGAGGGGILCLTALIVVDTIPLREQGKWFSLLGAVWCFGTIGGPLMGGGLAHEQLWRWIFWINLPFLGVGGIFITIFLNLDKKYGSFVEKLRQVDWVGIALFLTSTTGFLIPISRGGIECPWDSWNTLVPLCVCIAGIIAFAIHQEYSATNPLIRTDVFKNQSAAIISMMTTIYGIILAAVIYYLPLYFEAVKGMSPVMAGVAVFPWTLTVAPCAVITGICISKMGTYRWANWLGWGFVVVGMGLLVLLTAETSTAVWVVLNLVGGIGMGILYPAMIIAIQASSSAENQTYATNMFTFFRAFGSTLGVAVGGVIFQNQMEKKMLLQPLISKMAREYSRDAVNLVQIIKVMPENEMKHQLRNSFAYALMWIWIVMAALAGVALVGSLFIKSYDISNTGREDKAR